MPTRATPARSRVVVVRDRSKKKTTKDAKKRTKSPQEVWVRISGFLSLKSPTTQTTYLTVFNEWCRFLGAEPGTLEAAKKIVRATDLHAIAYKSWLEKRPGQKPRLSTSKSTSRKIATRGRPQRSRKKDGLDATQANATIAKKCAALRRIYRMLSASGLASARNPFDVDLVPPPSARAGKKRPTEMVEFNLVKKILALPNPAEPKGLRDHALLSVLFGGGLRRSEAAVLRIGDVRATSRGNAFLVLRSTKAKQDAQQVLPAWAARAVTKLVEARVQQGARSGDYLFISFRGRGGRVPTDRPISPDGIYQLFKRYCAAVGAEHASPHSARATAITKLLADGVSFREVQEFSRHSSVQMVEVYDKRRIAVDENPGRTLDYK